LGLLSHGVNSQPGEYFITICTYEKEEILGEIVQDEMRLSQEGIIAQQCWKEMPNHFKNVELDEYENKMRRFAAQHSQASGCQTISME
jgi:hypothetical protein